MDEIGQAAAILKKGGIIIYPTETVYGIGCSIFNKKAIKKLIQLKGRDFSKPLSVAVANWKTLEELVFMTDKERKIIKKLLPGPVTIILPKTKKIIDLISAGKKFVGIRFPEHKKVQTIIKKAGFPIITTSANFASQTSPIRETDVNPKLCLKVDFVVRGRCKYKMPSTVVDLKKRKIIRQGAGLQKVKKILKS